MTMILKKDFTSFNHRLFVVPVSVRAISFKSSPSGELSYYTKKIPETKRFRDFCVFEIFVRIIVC